MDGAIVKGLHIKEAFGEPGHEMIPIDFSG